MKHEEEQIQCAVAEYLDLMAPRHGFWWAHYPAGGRRGIIEASKFKRMGVKPGVADVLIIKDQRAYWIELKADKGRQSGPQMGFEVAMMLQRCPYAIARSLDDVIGIAKGWSIT